MKHGVYIHVPFCTKRCPYCDFSFVVRKHPPTDRFVSSAIREIASAQLVQADTVYFGGGTPSLLDPDAIAALLHAVPKQSGASVTLEANPEDRGRFAGFSEAGVNRLSVGVQALDDEHLAVLGRSHDAKSALAAVESAVARCADVSADLIFGVPGQTTASLLAAAATLIDAGVHHVSAYGLTVHEGTSLAKAARRGQFQAVADGHERDHFLALHRLMTERGFEHYEISNYALPGHRSAHNELYWTGAAYRGFGPSAHSFDPVAAARWWNHRSFDRWAACIETGESPVAGSEHLDEDARNLERLYLGLRRSDGVPADLIPAASRPRLEAALDAGLVIADGSNLSLSPEGMAVCDSLVETLLARV